MTPCGVTASNGDETADRMLLAFPLGARYACPVVVKTPVLKVTYSGSA
jgi:hypothetical protein